MSNETGDPGEMGGFDFSPFTNPITESIKAERRRQADMSPGRAARQIFRFDGDGTVYFHGYDVNEVTLLLEVYRAHLHELGLMGAQVQAAQNDAAHWRPVGPEDV